MADQWLIASNRDSSKVLAQHGWTATRRNGMFFASEADAQQHIDNLRIPGHTTRAAEDDMAAPAGTPGAALSEYDPYGMARFRR